MNADDLTGKELDAWMYKHACRSAGKTPSDQQFDEGYAKGQFHFQEDPLLLAELIAVYAVNVQRIGEEWLAFKDHVGGWGESPQQAACRWVVQYHFGKELASAK